MTTRTVPTAPSATRYWPNVGLALTIVLSVPLATIVEGLSLIKARNSAGWGEPSVLALFAVPEGDGWRDITAAQFRDDVLAVAKGFVAGGLEPGDKVGFIARTTYEWTLIDFALFYAGAVLLWGLAGFSVGGGPIYGVGLVTVAGMLSWQLWTLDAAVPGNPWVRFNFNRWVGLVLSAALLLEWWQ